MSFLNEAFQELNLMESEDFSLDRKGIDGLKDFIETDDNVDFVKLAESLGAKGIRVTKKEEVADAIREAIALNAPVVIDCQIDSDDKVFPMVAPGAAISEAFSQEDLD